MSFWTPPSSAGVPDRRWLGGNSVLLVLKIFVERYLDVP
jgi:hypothetical protein